MRVCSLSPSYIPFVASCSVTMRYQLGLFVTLIKCGLSLLHSCLSCDFRTQIQAIRTLINSKVSARTENKLTARHYSRYPGK